MSEQKQSELGFDEIQKILIDRCAPEVQVSDIFSTKVAELLATINHEQLTAKQFEKPKDDRK
ncbi:hypothetical protein HGB07_10140 [Candidatus Roizmanbacteria bacterium]|nr:hypothetical protein [Candidatus Roizmanbacteria bacterium]